VKERSPRSSAGWSPWSAWPRSDPCDSHADMRKSELCGLLWSDVDLVSGRVRGRQQLLTGGAAPTFVPVKGKQARTVDIASETVELLNAHKSSQAALKMRNRLHYHDHGLVFAKEWSDVGRKHDVLGDPLQANNLGQREFARLVKAAGVRSIKFHGLRHTSATLLPAADVPSKVVQERLGHKKIGTTLDVYAHVLPSMQRDAARRLAALLHRR
jgi:integrase